MRKLKGPLSSSRRFQDTVDEELNVLGSMKGLQSSLLNRGLCSDLQGILCNNSFTEKTPNTAELTHVK